MKETHKHYVNQNIFKSNISKNPYVGTYNIGSLSDQEIP